MSARPVTTRAAAARAARARSFAAAGGAALTLVLGRRAARRAGRRGHRAAPARRRPRARAAARARGHHPPAGRRQGARSVAAGGGDLRRVALPRRDLARRRARPHADHARDGALHRPRCRAGRAFEQGDLVDAAGQHLLRRVLPALPAAPLRPEHRPRRSPRTTAARATSIAGWRRRACPSGRSAASRSRSPRRASTSIACSTPARATARSTAASSGWRPRAGGAR